MEGSGGKASNCRRETESARRVRGVQSGAGERERGDGGCGSEAAKRGKSMRGRGGGERAVRACPIGTIAAR